VTALIALALAAPPADNFGDPLPAGATARVGTTKMYRPGGWTGAVLTPDGKSLLVPTRDGPVERWDVATGRVVGTVGEKRARPVQGEYLSVSADGTRVLSLTDSAATVSDARTGRVLTEVVVRTEWGVPTTLATAALSADGKTLAFVAADPPAEDVRKRTAVVWDVGAAKRRLDVEVDEEHPGVALSADGKVLATWGAADTPVRFWDATTGKKLGAVTLKGAVHTSVALVPDGRAALTDRDGAVRLFDPKTGREVGKLGVRADPSGDLAFSPDGKRLAVGHFHGTVRVWDVSADKELSQSDGPVSTRGVAVAFAGDRLLAWGADWQKAAVWEVPSGKWLSPGGSGVAPGSLAFAPDGKELLSAPVGWTAGTGWTVRRWDPATGRAVGEWKFGDGRSGTHLLRLPPGGTKVEVYGGEGSVYDLRTGKRLHALGWAGEGRLCAAGELFLSPVEVAPGQAPGGPARTEVKEVATGKVLATIELPAPFVYPPRAARTPDRARLVTAAHVAEPGRPATGVAVALWDLATGKKVGEVTLPPLWTWRSLAVGPDGKTVLAGGPDRLHVLDLVAGKVVREVDTGALSPTTDPVYRPDGKVFAVGLQDHRGVPGDPSVVAVYDAATYKQLRAFRGHAGLVTALAFSPDGARLASGSFDTTVLVWDVSAVGR
jgi:WD40 repeat protein